MALSSQVVLQLRIQAISNFQVRFVRPDTDVLHIGFAVNMLDQPQPCFPRGWTISLRRQPPVFDTGDHRESEHASARSLGPAFGMNDELTPQAVFALEPEQRGDHLLIAIK